MPISAMGNKSVVLGLAMCLVLSSFHEVSCQVGGTREFVTSEGQGFESNVETFGEKATLFASQSVETKSEASHEAGQSSSGSDDVRRLMQAYAETLQENATLSASQKSEDSHEVGLSSSGLDDVRRLMQDYNEDNGSDGVNQDAELMNASEIGVEEDITTEKSKQETRGTSFQWVERTDDESDIHQRYYGSYGEKESASMGSRHQYESKKASMYVSRIKTSSSGPGILGSLGIGQSGAWRCFNQDKNGVQGDESIVIPKYELNDIIEEESIKGALSKTSSLMKSLTEIVDSHKKGLWTDVKIGNASIETEEKVKNLKTTLKKYVDINVRELVARSDYEEIMTSAAQYEELTSTSATYISRLATYGTVIREGMKASQRLKNVHQRVISHEKIAIEKQKWVDNVFKVVKALAEKGDNLSVKIFAMKQAVLKLEAEKNQVDLDFQKIVENLSRVLKESSQAYAKHRVVVREWKQMQASVDYSLETIKKAEDIWVQFLRTL